jgi:hypothetical protein
MRMVDYRLLPIDFRKGFASLALDFGNVWQALSLSWQWLREGRVRWDKL